MAADSLHPAGKPGAPGKGKAPASPGGREASPLPEALASALAAGDIHGSLRGLMAIGNPAARMAAVTQFVQSLPKERWPEVFQEYQRMEGAGEFRQHQNMMRAAASTWELIVSAIVDEAPESFLKEKLKTDAGRASDTDAESVLSAWAERDLPSAVAYFDSTLRQLKPHEMQGAAGHLASDYLRLDPDKAMGWLATLPDGVRGFCTGYAMKTLSQEDPAKAARILSAHDTLPDADDLALAVAQRWTASDPAQAFAWASQLPPKTAAAALRGVLDGWTQTDFAAASRHVEQLDPAARSAALPGLVEHAPDDMIPSLAAQLGRHTADEHQASAAATLTTRWAEQDPAAASAWLISEPASPMRDAAIRGFTQGLANDDPSSALEWAAVIGDSETRWGTLKTGIREWLDKDPEAARQWVQTSATLSAPDRERLLRRTGR
jgi:hypothetical protein